MILDLLESGALSLTSVRLLARHLTPQNHAAVLERAKRRTRQQIETPIAELAPQPDVPSSVRKLPARAENRPSSTTEPAAMSLSCQAAPATASPPAPSVSRSRPIVRASAPERYRVQFTIGQESHEKLRRLQALLRREIPDGDPGMIFDRAVSLLLDHVEKTKLGKAVLTRQPRAIRPGTDKPAERPLSRHISRKVKGAVWARDGGQCAFVASTGWRCPERMYLEFHHVRPHAHLGPPTVENLSLRCRRHNQYEAELVFGPRADPVVRESPLPWQAVTSAGLRLGDNRTGHRPPSP